MDKLDTLGARLRWARRRMGFTQAGAAKAVGMSQPSLSDLENDNTKGTTSLLGLASLYGVDAQWLQSGRGVPPDEARGNKDVNSMNKRGDAALSIELVRMERARVLAETLLDVSNEMRSLIDRLIQADHEGGAVREMTIAGVGYLLQSVPVAQTQKKVK